MVRDCFKIIGYYICEIQNTPEWLHGMKKRILSVSGCLAEQHPKWECFMDGWQKGESQIYQKRLGMNAQSYREFLEAANQLFTFKRIDVDCRFLQLSDAQYFYKRISPTIPCYIVSVSTTPVYFEILERELKNSHSHGLMNGEVDNSSWIGSDILGWDIGGFHSFLCNSLQNGLPTIKWNDLGLIENDFCEVAGFSSQIEGKGEPVRWIPCKIGRWA